MRENHPYEFHGLRAGCIGSPNCRALETSDGDVKINTQTGYSRFYGDVTWVSKACTWSSRLHGRYVELEATSENGGCVLDFAMPYTETPSCVLAAGDPEAQRNLYFVADAQHVYLSGMKPGVKYLGWCALL